MTLETLLQASAPHLPAPLVSVDNLLHLRDLAAWLPRGPVHRCGIECRLGEGLLRTDFSVCLRREGAARLAHSLAERDASAETVVRLARLCASWRDSASSLFDRLHEVWLEFDLEGTQAKRPGPVVFLSALRWNEAVGTDEFVVEVARLCHEASALHSGADAFSIDPPVIDRCLRHLPAGAVVLHIGALGAPRTQALRLVINVGWQDVVTYLEQIGWPGPIDDVAQLAARYGGWADTLSLCLDFEPALAPHIGVELFPSVAYDNRAEMRALLDLLVSDGLCAPIKREQVLGWPGSSPLEGGGLAGRTLSHLKISLRDGSAEAKVYLVLAEVKRVRTGCLLPLYAMQVGGDCA